jgi:hypothetical protein
LPTIGFLGAATPLSWTQWTAAFVQRLRELGWVDGRTVTIEYRWAEGRSDRYTEIAVEGREAAQIQRIAENAPSWPDVNRFVQPSSTSPPSRSSCAMLAWLEASRGPANASIQNNSALPQGLAVQPIAG